MSAVVYRNLARDFDEARFAVGMSGPNLLELWVSAAGHTVSLIVTTPQGVSCFIATAIDWQVQKIEIPLPPERPL